MTIQQCSINFICLHYQLIFKNMYYVCDVQYSLYSQPPHSISVTLSQRQLNMFDLDNCVIAIVFHQFSDEEVTKISCLQTSPLSSPLIQQFCLSRIDSPRLLHIVVFSQLGSYFESTLQIVFSVLYYTLTILKQPQCGRL